MLDVPLNRRVSTYAAPETTPADFICRVLRIPNDLRIIAAVSDVLAYLSLDYVWEASTGVSEIDMRAIMSEMVLNYFVEQCEGTTVIGEFRTYISGILPSNVLPCDGSEYDQADYPTLAAILPASLKDDVEGTFVTPDLRGRFLIGSGSGYDIADTGGAETHTLTTNEMPIHGHGNGSHSHSTEAHNHTQEPHDHSTATHNHTIADHAHTVNVKTNATGFGTGVIATSNDASSNATRNASTVSQSTGSWEVEVNPETAVNNAATVTVNANTVGLSDAGGDVAHNNMPPYFAAIIGIVAR